jgi:uncharacterized iron-regulated protein
MSDTIPHPRATWLDPDTGRAVEQGDLLRRMATKQVVLLGESHDIAEIHRWQMHVAAFLHVLRPNMAIGFEMFPRRIQPVLDAWVAGEMDAATFVEKSEWETVWGFDPAIYFPLFHFCRQQNVRMLALNCHRPLVTRVGKDGWDAIPVEERDGVTPSKPATPAHRQYLYDLTGSLAGAGGPPRVATSAMDPAYDRFVRAQQTWDRAFACNIANAVNTPEPPLVIGIIGRGHLEYGHGTPYQLNDLGVNDVAILLPTDQTEHKAATLPGIADAIFRLDVVEPRAQRRARPELARTA